MCTTVTLNLDPTATDCKKDWDQLDSKILQGPWTARRCRLPSRFVDDASWHLTLIPTPVRVVLRGTKYANESKFTFSGYLKSWPQMTFDHDLWPFGHMNIQRFPYNINTPSLVPITPQLFKWGHFHIFSLCYNLTSDDLWPWYVTFDLISKLSPIKSTSHSVAQYTESNTGLSWRIFIGSR